MTPRSLSTLLLCACSTLAAPGCDDRDTARRTDAVDSGQTDAVDSGQTDAADAGVTDVALDAGDSADTGVTDTSTGACYPAGPMTTVGLVTWADGTRPSIVATSAAWDDLSATLILIQPDQGSAPDEATVILTSADGAIAHRVTLTLPGGLSAGNYIRSDGALLFENGVLHVAVASREDIVLLGALSADDLSGAMTAFDRFEVHVNWTNPLSGLTIFVEGGRVLVTGATIVGRYTRVHTYDVGANTLKTIARSVSDTATPFELLTGPGGRWRAWLGHEERDCEQGGDCVSILWAAPETADGEDASAALELGRWVSGAPQLVTLESADATYVAFNVGRYRTEGVEVGTLLFDAALGTPSFRSITSREVTSGPGGLRGVTMLVGPDDLYFAAVERQTADPCVASGCASGTWELSAVANPERASIPLVEEGTVGQQWQRAGMRYDAFHIEVTRNSDDPQIWLQPTLTRSSLGCMPQP